MTPTSLLPSPTSVPTTLPPSRRPPPIPQLLDYVAFTIVFQTPNPSTRKCAQMGRSTTAASSWIQAPQSRASSTATADSACTLTVSVSVFLLAVPAAFTNRTLIRKEATDTYYRKRHSYPGRRTRSTEVGGYFGWQELHLLASAGTWLAYVVTEDDQRRGCACRYRSSRYCFWTV